MFVTRGLISVAVALTCLVLHAPPARSDVGVTDGTNAGGGVTGDGGFVEVGSVRVPRSGRGSGIDTAINCRFWETLHAPDAPIPLPGEGAEVFDLVPGMMYWRRCFSVATGRLLEGPTVMFFPLPGAADAHVPALEQALRQLVLGLPAVGVSPTGEVPVNMEVFFWDSAPRSRSVSAAAGGVSATLVAHRERLDVAFHHPDVRDLACLDDEVFVGDVSAMRRASDCHSFFAIPSQDLTVDVSSRWHLTWTASNGQAGDLGIVTRTTTIGLRVQEFTTAIRTK